MLKIGTKVYPLSGLMDIKSDVDVKDIYGIVTRTYSSGVYEVIWLSTKQDEPIDLLDCSVFMENNLTTNRKDFLTAYSKKEELAAKSILNNTSDYFVNTFKDSITLLVKGNRHVYLSTAHYDPLKDVLFRAISTDNNLTVQEKLNIVNGINLDDIEELISSTVTDATTIYIDAVNATHTSVTEEVEDEEIEDEEESTNVDNGTQEGTDQED